MAHIYQRFKRADDNLLGCNLNMQMTDTMGAKDSGEEKDVRGRADQEADFALLGALWLEILSTSLSLASPGFCFNCV